MKDIDELKAEIATLKEHHPPPVVMIRRKAAGSGNPVDYFEKNFSEYQEGFSANGEFIIWWKQFDGRLLQAKAGLALTLFTN